MAIRRLEPDVLTGILTPPRICVLWERHHWRMICEPSSADPSFPSRFSSAPAAPGRFSGFVLMNRRTQFSKRLRLSCSSSAETSGRSRMSQKLVPESPCFSLMWSLSLRQLHCGHLDGLGSRSSRLKPIQLKSLSAVISFAGTHSLLRGSDRRSDPPSLAQYH